MKKFDFDDINLIPKMCIVYSRSECNTTLKFGKHLFKLPVVPANMISIINEEIALKLAKKNYFYIMHRFNFNSFEFTLKMKKLNLISSISVGIKNEDCLLIDKFKNENVIPDYITIDVAHGHSENVIKMIKYIKLHLPETFVIAGNICTQEAVIDLQNAGCDAIKVGVGPGHVCTTYMMTGFGSRKCQASTIKECSEVATVPIIADGGITNPGDIAKALTLGATMIMSGNLLAGCVDSPGELITIDNNQFKVFYGSASEHQPGKSNRIEGTKKLVPYNNKTLLQQLEFLTECIQSAISYGGGKNLNVFNNTKWK